MKKYILLSVAGALATVLLASASSAATIFEPALASDLPLNTVETLSTFNVSAVEGSYELLVPYGIWNGNGDSQLVNISLTFDGTPLSTIASSNAYYTTPESTEFDISSFVHTGANTLSVTGQDLSLAGSFVTEYAVGAGVDPVTVPGGDTLATPLPSAFPLFASALGMMAFLAWRKKQQA